MQGKAVLQPAAAVRSILRAAQKLPESRKPEMPYGRETVSGFPTDTTDPIFQIEIFPWDFDCPVLFRKNHVPWKRGTFSRSRIKYHRRSPGSVFYRKARMRRQTVKSKTESLPKLLQVPWKNNAFMGINASCRANMAFSALTPDGRIALKRHPAALSGESSDILSPGGAYAGHLLYKGQNCPDTVLESQVIHIAVGPLSFRSTSPGFGVAATSSVRERDAAFSKRARNRSVIICLVITSLTFILSSCHYPELYWYFPEVFQYA